MKNTSYFIILPLMVVCTLYILSQNNQKTKVLIGKHQFKLKVADTQTTRTRGLSNISYLPNDGGMLFIFEDNVIRDFWMKDTFIPLQIIFIENCTIVDIQEMSVEEDPAEPIRSYRSKKTADKAIELNSGSVSKNIIGSKINELCP